MSDFDFDKSFSEEFRQGRFETPSSGKWEQVAASLRQNEDKKRRRRFALLCLPYLLTAATLGLFFWKMQENQRQMAGLQVQVVQLEKDLEVCGQKSLELKAAATPKASPATESINAAKTISSHIRPFNNDYKVGKKEGVKMNTAFEASTAFSSDNTSPAKITPLVLPKDNTVNNDGLIQEPIDTSTLTAQPDSVIIAAPIAAQENTVTKPVTGARKPVEAGLSGTGLEITVPSADAPIMQEKDKRPRRFGIGLNLSFEKQIIKGPRNRLPYYVNACYLFNKGWRLEAGFEMKRFKYSDPSFIYPPPPPPPSQDYSISKVDYTYGPALLSLGVHRNFRLKKRFQPSVLVELVAYQIRNDRLDYKYNSGNTALPDVTITRKYGHNYWNLITLRFGAGSSYKILPWLESRAQVGYIVNPFFKDSNRRHFWPFYYKIGLMGYF